MSRVSILIGLLLVVVGVGSYALGGEHRSGTALIPAYIGAAIAALGVVVVAHPSARKHAMHAAATLGLLGFLASGGRLMSKLVRGDVPPPLAFGALALTLVLCGLFVVLCVASFVSARRKRPEDVAGLQPVAPK